MRGFLTCLVLVILLAAPFAAFAQDGEDEINLLCLKSAYPEIKGLERGAGGETWLLFTDGRKVLYDSPRSDPLNASVKASMAQIYPLEPERPDTPAGVAPGRARSYDLFAALYGRDRGEVRQKLKTRKMLNKNVSLTARAADALGRALADLEGLAARDKAAREFLKPEGGFYWRNIAGEPRLSAHSFGVALDVGVKKSPYWRWSRKSSHPLQKTYPREIVEIFEREGFIWGGKWHEYDIMHFEYRPELVCKSRLLKTRARGEF